MEPPLMFTAQQQSPHYNSNFSDLPNAVLLYIEPLYKSHLPKIATFICCKVAILERLHSGVDSNFAESNFNILTVTIAKTLAITILMMIKVIV